MSQVILGNIFGYSKDISQADENIIRHLTLNSIRMYKQKFKKYGEVILVFDSGDYWRKDEFPHNQGTRKLNQDQDNELWSNLWNIVSTVRDELEDNFPYKVMRVGRAEADDIIAYLAKKYHQTENIMIVSSDKDFQQLQRYENVHQYSPKNKAKVVCSNPKEFLINHIIKGDSSDGIPNILSDDDTLINPDKRQKRLTQKVLDTISEDLAFGELPKGHEDNWKRNQTLVDLDKVPDWINEKIEKRWNEPIKGKRNRIFNYFIKYKLKNLMECIEEF